MDRVSTSGSYSAVLANLMAAQQRQVDAGAMVSTQKNGTSLKDYSRNAEMLTAMTSIDSRLGGYLEQNTSVADKLTTQDVALNQVGLQQFNDGPDGPFSGAMTDAQRTFLESQLSGWDQVHKDLVTSTAINGMTQSRVEGVKTDLTNQQTTIKGMIGGITDADMAKAASNLTQAQLAVQAVAQVFSSLQNTSLLNVLK